MSEKFVSILLATDDMAALNDLTARLHAENFRVIPIGNRESIVTLARSERPDLILIDLDACFDICRLLKRSFVTEAIPVIALLSPAEEADRIAVLELGADDCMAKPFHFRELTLRIKRSLERARDKNGRTRYQQAKHYTALTRSSRKAGS